VEIGCCLGIIEGLSSAEGSLIRTLTGRND
jgi:hypothetical protein